MNYKIWNHSEDSKVDCILQDDSFDVTDISITATIEELIGLRDSMKDALDKHMDCPDITRESILALPPGFPAMTIEWEKDVYPDGRRMICPAPWLAWDYDYMLAKQKTRFASLDEVNRKLLYQLFINDNKKIFVPEKRYKEYGRKHPFVGSVFSFTTRSHKDFYLYVVENELSRLSYPSLQRCCAVIVLNANSSAPSELSKHDYFAGPYIIECHMFNDRYFRYTNVELVDLFPASEMGFFSEESDFHYAFFGLNGQKMDHLPLYQGRLFRETDSTFFQSIECELIAREGGASLWNDNVRGNESEID